MRKALFWLIVILSTQMIAQAQETSPVISPENAADTQLLAYLPGNALGFTADGKTLVTYSREDVWDGYQLKASFTHIYLWDIATEQGQDYRLDDFYDFPELTADGGHVLIPHRLESAGMFGGSLIWDVQTRQAVGIVPETLMVNGANYSASYDPQCAGNCEIHIWNLADASRTSAFVNPGNVLSATFNADETRLFILSTGQLQEWDTLNGTLLHNVPVEDCAQSAVHAPTSFSPDGHYLLTLCYLNPAIIPGTSKAIVWDSTTLQPIFKLDVLPEAILAFTPDSTGLVVTGDSQWLETHSTSNLGMIYLWDIATGQLKTTLQGCDPDKMILQIHFSPDGTHLLSLAAYGDKVLKLWNIATGDVNSTGQGGDYGFYFRGVFSREGSLVTLGAPFLYMTDMQGQDYWMSDTLRYNINSIDTLHVDGIFTPTLAFSPDGSLLVANQNLQTLVFGVPTDSRRAWTPPRLKLLQSPLDLVDAPQQDAKVIGQISDEIQSSGVALMPDARYLYSESPKGWLRLPYDSNDLELPANTLPENIVPQVYPAESHLPEVGHC